MSEIIKKIVKRLLVKTPYFFEIAKKMWNYRPNFRVRCYNFGFRIAGADDGLPIPPPYLINIVVGTREIAWFLRSSKLGSQSLFDALKISGIDIKEFNTILDFGCGCGRIIRRLNTLKKSKIYGFDYNPVLIKWCKKKLSHIAEFKINNLQPPLSCDGEFFDFIYAISVFTHTIEDLQTAWMAELNRILKNGGILLLTTSGESRIPYLESNHVDKFKSGEIVIKGEVNSGSNKCNAYHPEKYVRQKMTKDFEIINFIPRGGRDTNQDIWILKKVISKKDAKDNEK